MSQKQSEKQDLKRSLFEKIKKEGLISVGDRILVGVSGGCDSVFLLLFLSQLEKSWGLSLTVAHYNHCTRGKASFDDESFVASLCERWRIPLKVARWQQREGSAVSEEKARNARYAFFEEACREAEAEKIALAHTRDDDVETILFRLLRGSGLSGLRGIPYVRPLGAYRVIRPLKDVLREEIRRFLQKEKISWREDASNQDLRYTRNRIRHSLLPLLEKEFNPNIRTILAHLGKNVSEDYDYLQREGESAFQEVLLREGPFQIILKRRDFQTCPLAIRKQLFRQILRKLGTVMDDVGYSDWEAVEKLFGKKAFQYTLPGPLFLRGTPTKLIFAVPHPNAGCDGLRRAKTTIPCVSS